jgi:predicted phosphoribosyltransferase
MVEGKSPRKGGVVRFGDRGDAGRQLAEALGDLRHERPVVIGLARGGVVVAAEVARCLGAPLDVLVVWELVHPLRPKLGLGALCEGGVTVVNWELAAGSGIDSGAMHRLIARERAELDRRVVLDRGTRARVPVEGRTVVVLDDGMTTGFTARAAVAALRHDGARRIAVAVPGAPADALEGLRSVADGVVCLRVSRTVGSVGRYYKDFPSISDQDVARLLSASSADGGSCVGEPGVELVAVSGAAHAFEERGGDWA